MRIPATIRLSTCRSAFPVRPMIRIRVTARELHMLALAVDREADQARANGHHDIGETLDWRAAALRGSAQ